MKAIQNVFIVAYKAHIIGPHPLRALISSIFLLTPSMASLLFNNMPRISHRRFSSPGMLSLPGSSIVQSSPLDLYSNVMFLGPPSHLVSTTVSSSSWSLFSLFYYYFFLSLFKIEYTKRFTCLVFVIIYLFLLEQKHSEGRAFFPFSVLHPQC